MSIVRKTRGAARYDRGAMRLPLGVLVGGVLAAAGSGGCHLLLPYDHVDAGAQGDGAVPRDARGERARPDLADGATPPDARAGPPGSWAVYAPFIPPFGDLRGVWVEGDGHTLVIASTSHGAVCPDYATRTLHLCGSMEWPQGSGRAVHGDGTEGYIVGTEGAAMDAKSALAILPSRILGAGWHMHDVWCAGNGDVWLAGVHDSGRSVGRVHLSPFKPLEQKSPTLQSSAAGGAYNSVWGTVFKLEYNIVAVGTDGKQCVIRHVAHGQLTIDVSSACSALNAVWGVPGGPFFAVGDDGVILRADKLAKTSPWKPMSSGTQVELRGVWGTSAKHVFAVGDKGTVLYHDGSSWRRYKNVTDKNLYDVYGNDSTSIYAVGDGQTILKYSP